MSLRVQRALAIGERFDCVIEEALAVTDSVGTVDEHCVRIDEELVDTDLVGMTVEERIVSTFQERLFSFPFWYRMGMYRSCRSLLDLEANAFDCMKYLKVFSGYLGD